ncbi:uncharacterized protein BO95DRAFT_465711 [Aspergillus brunneoviolaceus CBS 621.78]|uniref:Uncharacterized protein n=1 Tax=Aspergillus brunneoviolaceus CBS 621.78 TaxID=1450534 RepID=A0ACD1G305_9EURO|nr:hypothetical protein BO95DRAFT_465711 [Aspergillus brunneoviolaceus CBS 621.78]RAH43567.1 hypothetical protein BO95DRAFT_465711 [Aspergillus brunneoviolaceus CBS 621.78]
MLPPEERRQQQAVVESVPSDMDGYSDLKCEICHQHQHPIQGTLFWRCSRCGGMHHDECVVLQPEFDANGLPTKFGCTKCRTPWFLRSELCCTGDCGEENGPEGADVDESLDLPEQHQPPVAAEVHRGCRQVGSHIPMSDRLESSDEHFICEQAQPRLEKRDARTLVASLVAPRSLSTVYTLIGVVSSVGMLIAGPLLAGMFHLGMVLGDLWVGLPFLVAAGFYALVLAVISAVRVGAVERE